MLEMVWWKLSHMSCVCVCVASWWKHIIAPQGIWEIKFFTSFIYSARNSGCVEKVDSEQEGRVCG